MIYHIVGFLMGFLLDLLLGDPRGIPHPVIGMGKMIAFWDRKLLKPDENANARDAGKEFRRGCLMAAGVILSTEAVCIVLLGFSYFVHPIVGMLFEAVMTWLLIACKDLKAESMKVYEALRNRDTEGARKAVSMIVGRDTMKLDEAGIIRAAVETVAENASDGVVAPMLYLCIGGPVGGVLYKAVNTMDSMVGYKNERYLHFGTAAAKLDDLLNLIPARFTALCMIVSAIPGKAFSASEAWRIFRRDRYHHKSPNSAQAESAAAGALGIRLGGDAYYFGKLVHKETIGDAKRSVMAEDIRLVNVLMYRTAFLTELFCLAALCGSFWILH